jgi:hypothetical protein
MQSQETTNANIATLPTAAQKHQSGYMSDPVHTVKTAEILHVCTSTRCTQDEQGY